MNQSIDFTAGGTTTVPTASHHNNNNDDEWEKLLCGSSGVDVPTYNQYVAAPVGVGASDADDIKGVNQLMNATPFSNGVSNGTVVGNVGSVSNAINFNVDLGTLGFGLPGMTFNDFVNRLAVDPSIQEGGKIVLQHNTSSPNSGVNTNNNYMPALPMTALPPLPMRTSSITDISTNTNSEGIEAASTFAEYRNSPRLNNIGMMDVQVEADKIGSSPPNTNKKVVIKSKPTSSTRSTSSKSSTTIKGNRQTTNSKTTNRRSNSNNSSSSIFGGKGTFPLNLAHMLESVESEGLSHIISWLECGTCFVIYDCVVFMTSVLPKFFR